MAGTRIVDATERAGGGTRRTAQAVTAALLAAMLLLGACSRQREENAQTGPRPVRVATVGGGAAASLREFAGRVERSSVSPLAFQVPGRIVGFAVRDGQPVAKGQLIARLDDVPYALVLRRAQAQYAQLADDVSRKAVLNHENILSDAAFDQLKTALEAAAVQRDLARRDLDNTRLVAPFAGRVLQRNVETEQTVQAGMPVVSFENATRVDIGIELPQRVAEALPLNGGLRAQAWTPDRPDQLFDLAYRENSTVGGPGASSYRLVFSTVRAPSVRLLPGMAVRVRVLGALPAPAAAQATVLTVPFGALSVAPDGGHRVWRLQDGDSRVHAVAVTPRELREADGAVVVEGDLHAGDRVVAAGAQLLRDGDAVRPLGDLR
ncbi:efflux RND transporter periplasmic adaptor subunit [Paraburkholderia caballeronis]|uniref:efflux RND transporter periplasmic adaptor subunit n=1 Tax=Paraburkholderia caballeronis TaxID=416943 RepID=UPI0010D5FA7B|nr:efflux RND transporter periplasmic adaptor subunit [Paraburkholderia caballeronis]TDV04979.1 RND family efflux transporter MFP subunit [Paraburkholderia caballeronis]TDV08147.1 RND family efflux transporter MFP subunit [Paraburkholderia caballeronis]TDV19116.1 RND family efflux transporter MFP subunit [Paraburkholderia caballeronis]